MPPRTVCPGTQNRSGETSQREGCVSEPGSRSIACDERKQNGGQTILGQAKQSVRKEPSLSAHCDGAGGPSLNRLVRSTDRQPFLSGSSWLTPTQSNSPSVAQCPEGPKQQQLSPVVSKMIGPVVRFIE
jgi:hypothetical protein